MSKEEMPKARQELGSPSLTTPTALDRFTKEAGSKMARREFMQRLARLGGVMSVAVIGMNAVRQAEAVGFAACSSYLYWTWCMEGPYNTGTESCTNPSRPKIIANTRYVDVYTNGRKIGGFRGQYQYCDITNECGASTCT